MHFLQRGISSQVCHFKDTVLGRTERKAQAMRALRKQLTDWVTSYSGKNSGIIGRKAKQKVTLETLDHGSDGLGAMVYGQAWVTERGQ